MEGEACVDQILSLKIRAEKYMEIRKSLYFVFMNLEKAYDRLKRNPCNVDDPETVWSALSSGGGIKRMSEREVEKVLGNCL